MAGQLLLNSTHHLETRSLLSKGGKILLVHHASILGSSPGAHGVDVLVEALLFHRSIFHILSEHIGEASATLTRSTNSRVVRHGVDWHACMRMNTLTTAHAHGSA